MALAMAICLFSLAGIPPLAGFLGKFNLFVAAFSASSDPEGTDSRPFILLAIIAVLNSAIGAYYYLKIVVAMYLREPVGAPLTPRLAWPTATAIGACSTLTVLLGFWAQPLYSASRASAEALVLHPEPVAVLVSTEDDRSSAEVGLQRANNAAREAAAPPRTSVAPAKSGDEALIDPAPQ